MYKVHSTVKFHIFFCSCFTVLLFISQRHFQIIDPFLHPWKTGTFLILHLMTSYTIETYTKSTTPSIDCVYVPRITYKLIRNHLNKNPDRFHGNQPGYCYILCIYKCIKLYVYFHTHTTSFSISHPQNIHTSYIHRTSTILNNMIYPFGDEQTRIFFFGKN